MWIHMFTEYSGADERTEQTAIASGEQSVSVQTQNARTCANGKKLLFPPDESPEYFVPACIIMALLE